MADLVITAADVIPQSDAQYTDGTAGEAIVQGEPVYLKAADGRFWRADANVSAAVAATIGLAVQSVQAGQPMKVQNGGSVALGAILTTATQYILSRNVGKVCPIADLIAGDYLTLLFSATSGTVAKIGINNTGALKA